MTEVWLRSNTRATLFAMALPLAMGLLGAGLLWHGIGRGAAVEIIAGAIFAGLGAILLVLFVWQWRRPRLAYRDGELLVYLRLGEPIHLPLEVAECVLMGTGPSLIPGRHGDQAKTRNLIIRLAESAPEWRRLEVKPALGEWNDGYVTFRGAWCEPLDLGVVQRLNSRLSELHARAAEKTTS